MSTEDEKRIAEEITASFNAKAKQLDLDGDAGSEQEGIRDSYIYRALAGYEGCLHLAMVAAAIARLERIARAIEALAPDDGT